jgi:hypothetical protein
MQSPDPPEQAGSLLFDEATAPKSTIDVYTYAVPCVHTAVSAETEREY